MEIRTAAAFMKLPPATWTGSFHVMATVTNSVQTLGACLASGIPYFTDEDGRKYYPDTVSMRLSAANDTDVIAFTMDGQTDPDPTSGSEVGFVLGEIGTICAPDHFKLDKIRIVSSAASTKVVCNFFIGILP